MLDKLATPPNIACWLWDEAGRKLKTAMRGVASPEHQVITWLLSLYGKANSFSPPMPGRKQNIPGVDKPFLVTLAASQPELLISAITSADVSAGLINRFLLIDPGEALPDDNFEREDICPATILDKVAEIRSVSPAQEFIRIRFKNGTIYQSFQHFQTETRRRASLEGVHEFWGRANQNALILAGLAAVGVDPLDPVIDDPIASWAMEFSRWSCARWATRLNESEVRSTLEASSKSIERQINDPKKYSARGTERMRELMVQGFMPRSMITRLNRNLTKREIQEVLDSLLDSDLIDVAERGGHEVFFRK